MTFSHMSAARFEGAPPEDLLAHVRSHMQGFDLTVHAEEDALRVELDGARVKLRTDRSGFDLDIAANDDVRLHQARESALFLLDHVFPGSADRVAWRGEVPRDVAPPNLHPSQVEAVHRVGRRFLRVVARCPSAAAMEGGGMHFSLLLPPGGRSPRWPRIGASGRTEWPEGEDALHRAAYTFVELDPEAGRFSFDVFEHEGGRTTNWARAAAPGDRFAVMGPGGGRFPPGERLLMAGDETALPAIRRILAQSAPERRGEVLLEIGHPEDRVPVPAPAGVSVDWVVRGEGPSLWERLQAAELPPEGESRFVWVAAEQALARRAKAWFRQEQGLGRDEAYIAAYWSEKSAAD